MIKIVFEMIHGQRIECAIEESDLNNLELGMAEGRGTYRVANEEGKTHIIALRHVAYMYEL